MHIIFETPRLILRRFTKQDSTLLLQLNNNPEVVKYLHEPTLETNEQALYILSDIILPQYKKNLGRWAIHKKENKEFIGWCGLKYRADLDEIDLGYRLFQHHWQKGYATEAARHTLEYGFFELQLPKITGRAHIENKASLHVLEKIGMKFFKEEIVDDCQVRTYIGLKKYITPFD